MRAKSRRLLIGGAVAASAVVACSARSAARADDEPTFGGGAFVGYRFGAASGFEWGLEGFATYRYTGLGCSSKPRAGLGPLAQLTFLGLQEPRLTLAMQGGGELERAAFALSGEIGVSYAFGADGGFGIHTGLRPELSLVNAGLSYEWFLQQGAFDGSVRIMPTYGAPFWCEVGRPLRTDAGVLTWSLAAPHDEAGDAIGRGFERDAQSELSSVPAFLQLASELVQAGAPSRLAQRALAAARDEQLHTVLCAKLAQRHLRRPIALALPDVARRSQLNRGQSLLRLARESWSDGCLAEGAAAAHAAATAQRASDPETRAVLARIARDEQRHAELAWEILAWALDTGGDAVRAEIERADEPAFAASDAVRSEHMAASRARLACLLA